VVYGLLGMEKSKDKEEILNVFRSVRDEIKKRIENLIKEIVDGKSK